MRKHERAHQHGRHVHTQRPRFRSRAGNNSNSRTACKLQGTEQALLPSCLQAAAPSSEGSSSARSNEGTSK
eukprot:2056262-Pleurochrysis_carterae.AAC.1